MNCYVCLPSMGNNTGFIKSLEQIFNRVDVHPGETRPTRDEIIRIAQDYEVAVCGMAEQFDSKVAENAESLKVIATLSIGRDHIAVDDFVGQGIKIISISQANVVSVAEHTWALILAIQKRLIESNSSVKRGAGRSGLTERPSETMGKSLGLIGAGPIAFRVAKLAKAFGCNTKVWTYHPDQHSEFDELAEFCSNIETLINESDIVSLHLPLSEKSCGILNDDLLSSVDYKKGRILVNTARADLVDESVTRNIGHGYIFEYGALDVFNSSDNKNIIYTPHTAGITKEASERMNSEIVAKLKQYADNA